MGRSYKTEAWNASRWNCSSPLDRHWALGQHVCMCSYLPSWLLSRAYLVLALSILAFTTMSCVSPSSSDGQGIRVAVCQVEVDSQPETNLRRIEAAIADAAARGADIACFPEACVFGWVNPMAHTAASPIPGTTTDRIAAMAKRYEMMVVLGLAERDGDQLYNAAVLIDSDGEILLRHRKTNILSKLMDPPYTAGPDADHSVVATRFGRIGLLICADTFKDPVVAGIAKQDPDLVIVPYGWAAPADKWPDHGKSLQSWVAQTARRCNAAVVGIDSTGEIHYGPWKGQVLGGQSVVCDAAGEVLAVLADRSPELRVFEFDRSWGERTR